MRLRKGADAASFILLKSLTKKVSAGCVTIEALTLMDQWKFNGRGCGNVIHVLDGTKIKYNSS